jgi:hypothetical protein
MCSVVNHHRCDADPDPSFDYDADPDPDPTTNRVADPACIKFWIWMKLIIIFGSFGLDLDPHPNSNPGLESVFESESVSGSGSSPKLP